MPRRFKLRPTCQMKDKKKMRDRHEVRTRTVKQTANSIEPCRAAPVRRKEGNECEEFATHNQELIVSRNKFSREGIGLSDICDGAVWSQLSGVECPCGRVGHERFSASC